MSNLYYVQSTDGTLTITLKPGQLNGPGGPNRDTDLRLYGMGALLWGEGVDQNLLRLTENFACHEKAASPGTPQDESDLGPGKGITTPIPGQPWFNKTDELMYYYTGTVWKKTSSVVVNTTNPDSAEQGDLWYDLDVTTGCGLPTLKLYDPTHPDADVNGWVKIGFDRLSVCGGDMGGTLSMSDDGGTTRNVISNLGDPIDPYDAVHKTYVDDAIGAITGPGGTLSLHMADDSMHLTVRQNEMLDTLQSSCMNTSAASIQVAADICALKGYTASTGTVYADLNGKLDKTGGSMTGFITLHADPTANYHAATKKYVDDAVGGATSSGSVRFVSFFSSTSTGTPRNGDVAVESNIVYIYRNGWVQVFPAQYS